MPMPRSAHAPAAHARSWKSIGSVLALTLLSGQLVGIAQSPRVSIDEVKAVYLLNFGRFTRWPANESPASAAFPVCVLGRDPFGGTLDTIVAGEKIEGRPVVTRRLRSPDDAAGCRILFISESEAAHLKEIFQQVDRAATLTVSDIPRFADQGGMIQFVSEGNRVRFAVNVSAAEQARVTLSSELLRVAVSVKGGRLPEA